MSKHEHTLGEIVSLKYGKALRNANREPGIYPVYGSGGIIGTHSEPLVRGPGIIVGRKGSAGTVYFSKSDFYPIDTVFYVELRRPRETDLRFIFYLLMTMNLQQLNSHAAVPGINREAVEALHCGIPAYSIQTAVSKVLSAYDDLIENNRRRIQVLEEMARAIYREWFVHFRFPGHEEVEMVNSEMGEIPEGWSVKRLESVCDIVVGQSPKSEHYNENGEGLPFHQGVTDFREVIPRHRIYCTEDKRVAQEGDILFSVRAPVGRINLADRKLIVGRGLHAIRHRQGRQAFLLYQLKSVFFKEDIMGGGTVFQAVTKGDVLGLNLLIPSDYVLDASEEAVQPMVKFMVNLVKQNDVLSSMRDLLLPKLVSGEIDVTHLDAEAVPTNSHQTSKYKEQVTLDQWKDGDGQDADMGR